MLAFSMPYRYVYGPYLTHLNVCYFPLRNFTSLLLKYLQLPIQALIFLTQSASWVFINVIPTSYNVILPFTVTPR